MAVLLLNKRSCARSGHGRFGDRKPFWNQQLILSNQLLMRSSHVFFVPAEHPLHPSREGSRHNWPPTQARVPAILKSKNQPSPSSYRGDNIYNSLRGPMPLAWLLVAVLALNLSPAAVKGDVCCQGLPPKGIIGLLSYFCFT